MKPTLLCTAALAALLIIGCSKDENSTADDTGFQPKANENGLADLQAMANENLTQRFRFTAGREQENVRMETESGVVISVNPSRLTVRGRAYTGPVNVEYIELFDTGAMVAANKTTMATTGEGGNNPDEQALLPLASGGEFYVNMTTAEGQNIDDGTPYTLEVPTELTGGDDEDMTGWKGEENDDNGNGGDGDETDEDDVTWEEETDGGGQPDDVPVVDNKYIFELLSFGWGNIDKLMAIPGPRTTIYIDVPAGYDNTNSKVYLAYTTPQPTVAPMDTYDAATELFSEHYGQVPIGLQAHVIFVADGGGGQWIYAAKPVTIAANGLVTVDATDLITTTQASLITALNGLP